MQLKVICDEMKKKNMMGDNSKTNKIVEIKHPNNNDGNLNHK